MFRERHQKTSYIVSSSSVVSFTLRWIIGRVNTSPATSKAHVDRNIFMYLRVGEIRSTWLQWSGDKKPYGIFTPSARQMPAAPADWMDLSNIIACRQLHSINWREQEGKPLQKPVKCANFAALLDIAPISQYAFVCHIASRRPQKM